MTVSNWTKSKWKINGVAKRGNFCLKIELKSNNKKYQRKAIKCEQWEIRFDSLSFRLFFFLSLRFVLNRKKPQKLTHKRNNGRRRKTKINKGIELS